MSSRFEELDWRPTPAGDLTLRRRQDPSTGVDIFEVKLGDEYLMSSQFTVAEIALAELALARLDRPSIDIVVGGLGLGYTAEAVLADPRVDDLRVVDALEPVIEWHQRGLVPLGPALAGDPRCRLVLGDFFAMTAGSGYDDAVPLRRFDAIIVDIDHSPRHWLAEERAGFYGPDGTRRLLRHLTPGGIFALWSNDPPDGDYLAVLRSVFDEVTAEVVGFPNPLQQREATNTVYLGTAPLT